MTTPDLQARARELAECVYPLTSLRFDDAVALIERAFRAVAKKAWEEGNYEGVKQSAGMTYHINPYTPKEV